MIVYMKSQLTGVKHSMDLDVTESQMKRFMYGDGLIQNIFPNLSMVEREFLKSGITPEEWESHFGKHDVK